MKLKEKDPELLALMHQIYDNQYLNVKKTKQLCLKLRHLAIQKNSSYAQCFAECYIADSLLSIGTYEQTLRQLNHALRICSKYSYPEFLIQVYNLFGILYGTHGQSSNSIESYLKALSYTTTERDPIHQVMISANICDMYLQLKLYKDAYPYAIKAYHNVGRIKDSRKREQFSKIITLNLSELYLGLGQPEDALKTIKDFEPTINGVTVTTFERAYGNTLALVYYQLNEKEKTLELLDHIIHLRGENFDERQSFFYTMFNALDILLAYHDKQRCETVLCSIESSEYLSNLIHYQSKLADYKVQYYQQFGTPDDLLHAYEHYYKMKKLSDMEEEIARGKSIQDKIMIHDIESKNKTLESTSNLDELTGIPNRRSLRLCLNQWAKQAIKEHVKLGIIIIDIDEFKKFNDSYGHLYGDHVISLTAAAIATTNKNFYPARFGGDEFFVLAYNCSNEEIETYLSDTLKKMRDLQNEKSKQIAKATLSAGYVNQFITDISEKQTLADNADSALYQAKNNGRNCYMRYV